MSIENLPLESSVQVFNRRLHLEASVGGNTYCVMTSTKLRKLLPDSLPSSSCSDDE